MALPMIEGLSLEAQARFKVLQQTFVTSLARRFQEIENATTAAALQMALHQLCGSAGSFGFDSLSQHARAAEALVLPDRQEDLALALVLLKKEIEIAQSDGRTDDAPARP